MSSSAVSVAASDPGEPKRERASSGPAGDSDVAMTEASEEAPADPMYATEAAGMVVAEGRQDESNGDDLGVGAGALAGQPEWKPVPAGDVAGEDYEADPSELEENHVDGEGDENGVAYFDEGTQNGEASDVQCARYSLPPLDQDGVFRVSDLVWGKVKSHPWWPGEIFDPSNASELALKHQKKGSRLVAYFGDNSFAWCDESQLKPFVTNYSQMEKQSSADAFVGSVNYALEELSRRILSGMSCSCLPEELSDNGMSYMVENAGLKDGVTCSSVNRNEILTSFSPESLLHYIKSLALLPGQGGDLLELVIACSQLTSLYRSKGCPELASFQTGSAWVEDVVDTPPTDDVIVEEVVVTEVPPTEVKPKRGRGRPRKHRPEDSLKGASSVSSNNASYNTPQSVKDYDKKRSLESLEDSGTKSPTAAFGGSFKIGECIRRAANQLTGSSSVGKSQNEPAVYKNTAEAENAEFDVSSDDAAKELTVEKCAKRRRMHRHLIADPKELFSQLCSVAVEPMDRYDSSPLIISYFSDYRNYIVSATTEANVIQKTASKRGRKKKVLPSPELETTDHMQDSTATDHMLDSYWSGLSLHNHPIHSLKRAATNTRPRRKRKSLYDTYSPSVQPEEVPPKKQIQVIERSIIHVDEKIVDEWKPTALVLSFARSTALPSETDLIKKFGRYGPLKESETEVQKNTNTVKVVFKKRADAERAFNVAGKYSTFGPSLRSYRLVNMPFSLGVSEPTKPEARPGDHGPEAPGLNKSEVSLDTLKVNQVDKTEKVEAVKASSGEQDETIKKTCQAEPVKESSGEQVETIQQASEPGADMVKKTGQIDAELTGPSDQTATAAHSAQAKSIAQESSQQVPEETRVQAQSFADKPAEQDVAEQTMEIQAPKEASVEIPCNVKLEKKALTEESVDQVATEQVKVPSIKQGGTTAEADTAQDLTQASVQEAGSDKQIVEPQTAEVADEQVSCPEQIVQVEDVIDASRGQTCIGKQTAEDITMAEAVVEDKAAAGTLGDAIEGKTTTVAPGDGEATSDVPDEKTEKATAEALAGETTEGETAAEAPNAETTTAGKTADSVTVEAPDGKATTTEKAVEDGMAEATEDTVAERTVEGVSVEAPDEKATTAEKPVEDASVEAPHEKATTAEKPVEVAMVEASDEKATTAEKPVENAKVEAPDEKVATAES